MNNLENFINGSILPEVDPLIRCAIGHYQFEAIHPFSDGNGRTGRILVVLSLVNAGILSLPILYISGYINKNKNDYYRLLLEVTTNGNWDEYILFMLNGFYLQAKETKDLLFKIMKLFFDFKKELKKDHKKIYSADLVEALFSYPVITPVKLANELGIHYTTASRYLVELEKSGTLSSKKIGKYHFFANKQLLQIIHA
jgi:Fic family protein